MMKRIVFIIIFILTADCLFAETIVFKSGKTLEAKILERAPDYIKVDIEGVALTYFLDEIISIDGKPATIPQQSVKKEITGGFKDSKINEIFEKIVDPMRSKKRSQEKIYLDIDISGFMQIKMENNIEVDTEHKIYSQEPKIKDYSLNLTDALKAQAIQNINRARKNGVSEDKIRDFEIRSEKIIHDSELNAKKLSETMKRFERRIIIVDDIVYIDILGKWAKFQEPRLSDMWRVVLAQDSSQLKEMSKQNKMDLILGLFSNMFIDEKETEKFYELSEEVYEGRDCFVLNLKPGMGYELIKDELVYELLEIKDSKGVDMNSLSIKSLTSKQYISKDDFCPIYSTRECTAFLIMRKDLGRPDKIYFKENRIFNYPTEKLTLPPEAKKAVLVQDANEIKRLLGSFSSTSQNKALSE